MKFNLPKNAISSLSISLEHFKNFYYYERSKKLNQSEFDEEIKIALVFLENAIELLLKCILVSIDETCIYLTSEQKIQKAKLSANKESNLQDILLQNENLKTIRYCDAVEKYIKYRKDLSPKVEQVLTKLSNARNSITHFGLEITSYDEIVLLFFNTFDVILNYLYDDLCAHEDVGEYFISDNLSVNTIHGTKFLLSEDHIYNNILDLLDEVLTDNNDYIFNLRAKNNKTKILHFKNLFLETIADDKFKMILNRNNVTTNICVENILNNDFCFDMNVSDKALVEVLTRYSPFYNATIFMNDAGEIIFIVVHNEGQLYFYNDSVIYPEANEPEKDMQWIEDERNNKCDRFNLSKRNLIKIFEQYIIKLLNTEISQ